MAETSDSRMASLLHMSASALWSTAVAEQPSALATLRVEPDAGPSSSEPRIVPAAGDEGAPAEYAIVRRLGEGGMGVVFEAKQISLGRTVALKMIRAPLQNNPSMRARFFAEASLCGELEHPGIVTVFDAGITDQGRAFYAMRLVKGRPWNETIRSRPLDQNLAIWTRVVEAVGFAHGQGILHNDLKPANILVDDRGTPWVGDWGLALRIGAAERDTPGQNRSHGGTPAYMPPEIARGDGPAGPASDIYLLGAMLYEIVAGRPPHMAQDATTSLDRALRNDIDFSALSEKTGTADSARRLALLPLLRSMLSTDPASRPPSTDDVLRETRKLEQRQEAKRLTAKGRQQLAEAHERLEYDRFQDAVGTFDAAERLGAPEARAAGKDARLAHARLAFSRGDFALSASLAQRWIADDLDAARLANEATAALKRQRVRKRARNTALVLGVFLLLVVAYLALDSRQAVTSFSSQMENESEANDICTKFIRFHQDIGELANNPIKGVDLFMAGKYNPRYRQIRDEYIQENISRHEKQQQEQEREARIEKKREEDIFYFEPIEIYNPIFGPEQDATRTFAQFKKTHPKIFAKLEKLTDRYKAQYENDLDARGAPMSGQLAQYYTRQAQNVAQDADALRQLAKEAEQTDPDDPVVAVFAERLRSFADYYNTTDSHESRDDR